MFESHSCLWRDSESSETESNVCLKHDWGWATTKRPYEWGFFSAPWSIFHDHSFGTRVPDPFTGRPANQKQFSTNETFFRGFSSCNPAGSCMENMHQLSWSYSSIRNWWTATRKSGNCHILGFNSQILTFLTSCWTEVYLKHKNVKLSLFSSFATAAAEIHSSNYLKKIWPG